MPFDPQIAKGVFFFLLVMLSVSSFLLVANFSITKDNYYKIASLSETDIANAKKLVAKAASDHSIVKRNENLALIISGVVTILSAFALFFFFQPKVN